MVIASTSLKNLPGLIWFWAEGVWQSTETETQDMKRALIEVTLGIDGYQNVILFIRLIQTRITRIRRWLGLTGDKNSSSGSEGEALYSIPNLNSL